MSGLQRAVAVLQMACAGEIGVEYLGTDKVPFDSLSASLQSFRLGKRFVLTAFNDCGCFDYIHCITEGGELLWPEEDATSPEPTDYLTKEEQRELERLLMAPGGIETISELLQLVPQTWDDLYAEASE